MGVGGWEELFMPPREVAKISGARFMWPWTLDQGAGRYFIYILGL